MLSGCGGSNTPEVVVYAALDREFSEPILDDFHRASGVRVLAKYDVESTKTVGLATALLQERNRPRCDLFWNNEILHTLRLEQQGLLECYHSPAEKDFPPGYVAADGAWRGFAARARVLIVNTERVPSDRRPNSILDLVDPQWRGQVGVAKPLFGTTATHAAVLCDRWGEERAKQFFTELQQNAVVLAGNKPVAQAVGSGELAFGLTDTDDAILEVDAGRPVVIVYPDQGEGELGALRIPNTLCLIKNGPHPEAAKKLVDYLLQPAVERRLAAGPSAQFPVNPAVKETSRAAPGQSIRWMQVDFPAAARQWETTAAFLQEIYTGVD
ncbi:extracellular solute-binding protein [Lignipirellula cremea]|uniref:extracellular solute-binding protein n=1 Tax=Lignipirellula cremea TaxID=2528010 RepID=UPI001E2A3ABB|nr:extracellular solute-binding protein [Lignipirellula cremea]